MAALRRQVLEVLGAADAVWNADGTGFPKKGTKSVGVQRQYSGTLDRTDNCQVAVFANYGSAKGHTFVDRRLFRPEDGASDPVRRAAAGAPEGMVFRTKPALVLEMMADAVAAGAPFWWAGGDCVCGGNPTFVHGGADPGPVVRVGPFFRHPRVDPSPRVSARGRFEGVARPSRWWLASAVGWTRSRRLSRRARGAGWWARGARTRGCASTPS